MNTNYLQIKEKHAWPTPKDFRYLLEHSYQRTQGREAEKHMQIEYRQWLRVSENELCNRLSQAKELVCLTEV